MKSCLSLVAAAALLAAAQTTALADPLTVSFPSVGLEAQTESITVDDGQLGVPQDPDNLGTYAADNNLIVVGHVDWAGQRRVLSFVRDFQGGEPIELSDGRTYHVDWTEQLSADDDADFAQAVAPTSDDVLTLITCSGPFSISRHEYLDRTVIRAVRDGLD